MRKLFSWTILAVGLAACGGSGNEVASNQAAGVTPSLVGSWTIHAPGMCAEGTLTLEAAETSHDYELKGTGSWTCGTVGGGTAAATFLLPDSGLQGAGIVTLSFGVDGAPGGFGVLDGQFSSDGQQITGTLTDLASQGSVAPFTATRR